MLSAVPCRAVRVLGNVNWLPSLRYVPRKVQLKAGRHAWPYSAPPRLWWLLPASCWHVKDVLRLPLLRFHVLAVRVVTLLLAVLGRPDRPWNRCRCPGV